MKNPSTITKPSRKFPMLKQSSTKKKRGRKREKRKLVPK